MSNQDADVGSVGCAILLLVGAFYGLHQCTKSEPPTAEELEEQAAIAEENRYKGFHCLSAWDGSNRSLVNQVTSGLRDPDSFEHIETRITPVNAQTLKHGVSMTFRARNGFGGMNIGRAVGQVDPESCLATNILVDS